METSYDAIVIGSGISGGWAAKELCEKGLKTLVLERGRDIKHIKDYPTATMAPWDFQYRGRVSREYIEKNPLISKAAGFGDDTKHFFIQDADHPYIQEKPFDWIRGYQVGGKSLIWGRACQRWSPYEFTAPERQGYGMNWPINYQDIAPWYSHVEKFVGVCGSRDGLEAMPDGEFLPPFGLNCVETHMRDKIKATYPDRHMVDARWAQITRADEIYLQQGRGKCQARNMCMRGCPFGGYFSSVSSTLPWAEKTGNLTLRPHSVVHSILYNEGTKKASGVRVIDAVSKEEMTFHAKVIFLNASALNSLLILLHSKSSRFPEGLGNEYDLLGRYVAFHNYRSYTSGQLDGFEDKYYYGRNPTEPIIANYRNLGKQTMDFAGGYTIFTGAYRSGFETYEGPQFGPEFKEHMTRPGPWRVYMYMQGETIPKETNRVSLSDSEKDPWGIPLLVTDVGYDDNDDRMVKDFMQESVDMMHAAGCRDISTGDNHQAPGLDIHEMGGCRMGTNPKNSMLNAWNQMHLCKNVFVTDGACMTSTGNQSPSILYMALTARAVSHAVDELNKRNL